MSFLQIPWHLNQFERKLKTLRDYKSTRVIQTFTNRPGKWYIWRYVIMRQVLPEEKIWKIDCNLNVNISSMKYLTETIENIWWTQLQVFVLMQFGRKKDWPHGKLLNICSSSNAKYCTLIFAVNIVLQMVNCLMFWQIFLIKSYFYD